VGHWILRKTSDVSCDVRAYGNTKKRQYIEVLTALKQSLGEENGPETS